MKRIAVVGPSCSGKTTLAGKISACLGYPHTELDALFWGPDWSRREAFLQDVKSFKASFFSPDGIPIWILKTFGQRRRQYKALEQNENYSHISFIKLSSTAAVDQFVRRLRTAWPDDCQPGATRLGQGAVIR